MRPRASALAVVLVLLLALALACSPRPSPSPAPTPTPPASPGATVPPAGSPVADLPDAPPRDPFDLAQRYLGYDGGPLSDDVLYAVEPLGSSRIFWVIDPIQPSVSEVETTLQHVGQHALWYVADDVSVNPAQLAEAAREFDEVIFPHVMETFAPGVELPGPIAIVTAPLNALAGYFTASDALPDEVYRYSNQRVGVFMNTRVGTDAYLGTLAHEFQHVLHWLIAPTEDTWINEGLSEFAARSLGLPALPFTSYFNNPEVSPADWPEEVGASLPNYAGASLFIEYLAHRTGTGNIHRLIEHPDDGVKGIEAYLAEVAPDLTFERLWGDWLVANLVSASDGPYSYPQPPGRVAATRVARGPESGTGSVNQLGGWYMRIEPGSAPLTFEFQGATATSVLPVIPRSGETCWWGNRGDNINSTLTRPLDLTDVDEATLHFWTWYHIEESWDHGYLAVSTDEGASWTALPGRHTSTDDPMGVTYGPSYTGNSERWLPEEIDLSAYAGEEILLRFEYVTDEAVNTTGWCVDDIEVPQIGFLDDLETAGSGWNADGFVRLSSRGVQQRFLLRLVEGDGDSATSRPVTLDGKNTATFEIERPTTLIVTAMAPKTSQPALFSYEIIR